MYRSLGLTRMLCADLTSPSVYRLRFAHLSRVGGSHSWSNDPSSFGSRTAGTAATAANEGGLHDALLAIAEKRSVRGPSRPVTVSSQLPPEATALLNRLRLDFFRNGTVYANTFNRFLDAPKPDAKLSDQDVQFLISCCGTALCETSAAQRGQLLSRLLDQLSKLGVKLGVDHYNSLLPVYSDNGLALNGQQFMDNMKSEGIAPNQTTYELLVASSARQGDIGQATQLLSDMKKADMSITEKTFSSLIYAYLKMRDPINASAIEEVMKSRGIKAEGLTYAAKLLAHVDNGSVEEAESLLESAQSSGVSISDDDLLEAVFRAAQSGHPEIVDRLTSKLRRQIGFMVKVKRTAFRLISDGHFDTAFKLLRLLNADQQTSFAANAVSDRLLQRMVAVAPTSAICDMCQQMQEEQLFSNAFSSALRSAILADRYDVAEALLRRMALLNLEIRPNYFWPLFCMKNASNDCPVKTLHLMDELNVSVSLVTMADWFWKHASAGANRITCDSLATTPLAAAFSPNFIKLSYLCHLLQTADANTALEHANKHRITLMSIGTVVDALVGLFRREQDIETAVALLAKLNVMLPGDLSAPDFNGRIVNRLLTVVPQEGRKVMLDNMLHRRLRISPDSLEAMLRRGAIAQDTEVCERLRRLTAGQMDSLAVDDTAEKIIADFGTGGRDVSIRAERQLHRAIADAQYEEAVKLHDFLNEHYPSCGSVFSRAMIQLCLNTSRTDQALARFNDSNDKDIRTTLKLAAALVGDGRVPEAVETLRSFKSQIGRLDVKQGSADVNALLSRLVQLSNVSDVCDVLDTLFECGYAGNSNSLLAKCSRMILESGDLEKAVQFFDLSSTRFRRIPFGLDLLTNLIRSENSALLQRVYETLVQRKGDVYAWTMVSLALVSVGRVDQAKQLLQKRGRLDSNLLNMFCRARVLSNRSSDLEVLLTATQDVAEVSRDLLYCYLLVANRNSKSWQRTLKAWQMMKDEQFQPSARILALFQLISAECKRPLPDDLQHLLDEQGDNLLDAEHLSTVYSTVPTCEVNNLLNQGDLNGALQLYLRLARDGQAMPVRLTRQLFAGLRKAHNHQAMGKVKAVLSSADAAIVGANFLIQEAMIKDGQWERYLAPLEDNPHLKTSSALFATLLECQPDLEARLKSHADRAQAVGNCIPNAALWMYYATSGRSADADRLVKQVGDQALTANCRYMYVLERAVKKSLPDLADQLLAWIGKYQPDQLSGAVGYAIHLHCSMGNTSTAEKLKALADAAGRTNNPLYKSALARLSKLTGQPASDVDDEYEDQPDDVAAVPPPPQDKAAR